MSDTFTTDEDPAQQENHNLKLLREKAERADSLTAQLAQAERKNAILESGIDTSSKVAELFLKSWDGENNPEAIKAAAAEYGIPLKGEAPAEVVEELVDSGTDLRNELADGVQVGNEPAPDPNQVALENFKTAIASGATEEKAAGIFFNTLAEAASRGDERVIVR